MSGEHILIGIGVLKSGAVCSGQLCGWAVLPVVSGWGEGCGACQGMLMPYVHHVLVPACIKAAVVSAK